MTPRAGRHHIAHRRPTLGVPCPQRGRVHRETVFVDYAELARMRAPIPLPVVGEPEPDDPKLFAYWLGRRWREEATWAARGKGRDAR
jgi:hypothetical protein